MRGLDRKLCCAIQTYSNSDSWQDACTSCTQHMSLHSRYIAKRRTSMCCKRCRRKVKGKVEASKGWGGMDLSMYVPTADGYVRAADKWTREPVGVGVSNPQASCVLRLLTYGGKFGRKCTAAGVAAEDTWTTWHCRAKTHRQQRASSLPAPHNKLLLKPDSHSNTRNHPSTSPVKMHGELTTPTWCCCPNPSPVF